MKALSIKQPWAWLIVHGYKDVENRTWPTKFKGRIYVHAGKSFDHEGFHWLFDHRILLPGNSYFGSADYYCGGIVGEVDIVDCVTESKSPWFVGKYGFVLANAVAYEKPIPYKGKLGFFEVEPANLLEER